MSEDLDNAKWPQSRYISSEDQSSAEPHANTIDESSKPFSVLGEQIDTVFSTSENRGWLLFSLALALLLYLIAWFVDDAWRFAIHQVAQAGATSPLTLLPPTPTPTPASTPGATPSPSSTMASASPASLSPPGLFCGGMACGAFLMFIGTLSVLTVVGYSRRKRKTRAESRTIELT